MKFVAFVIEITVSVIASALALTAPDFAGRFVAAIAAGLAAMFAFLIATSSVGWFE